MDVYRTTPVPAIYTQLHFVREGSISLLADLPEDLPQLRRLQRVAAGEACVAELECRQPSQCSHTLVVKVELPDDILDRTGTSGDVIEWRVFDWKLWDAETLVTGAKPAEAVEAATVGITTDFLDSLADPRSCLPLLQTVEEAFDEEGRKGYQLDPKTADKIDAIEKRLYARIKLAKLKRQKPTRKSSALKAAGASPVSPKRRDSILRRDNYRCVFCGQDSSVTALEVNHIIPRSWIKKLQLNADLHTSPVNLCVTCFDCNRGKSDNLATEDVVFYLSAFASSEHPNHGILVQLEKIAELRDL